MPQAAVSFRCQRLTLEGVITTPWGLKGSFPAALVCHSHPLFGGSMHNPVVVAVCRALEVAGIASLRFNFRGVGASEGEFTNGQREGEDVAAALGVLRRWPGVAGRRLAVVGYSFGAMVLLQNLGRLKGVRGMVLIAPPVGALERFRARRGTPPALFMAGERDRIAPPPRLQQLLEGMRSPWELQVVGGVDHSWQGGEEEAARRTTAFLTRVLR